MALEAVRTEYSNSLYLYSATGKSESGADYSELLTELTTELELACKGGDEEPVKENDREDSEQEDFHSIRKKEWEELLEQAEVVEAMLRQMMENGLGQQQKEQQKSLKQQEEEAENDFDLMEVPATTEGRHKDCIGDTDRPGNSQLRCGNSGNESEYFSPSAAGRQKARFRVICLTCELDCDRKTKEDN